MKATIMMQKTLCAGCGGEAETLVDGFVPVEGNKDGTAKEYMRFRIGERRTMVHCEGTTVALVGEPYEKDVEYI